MSKLKDLIAELCPEGAEHKALGEIGSFYGGLSGKTKWDFKEGNASFITYMNVYSNPAIDFDLCGVVNITEGEKQNVVQYGDVLFTGSSETLKECGMSSVMTAHPDKTLYLNSFCFGYRFNDPDAFLPDFAKHLFRSTDIRNQIIRTAQGVTRYNISKKKMANVIIPVPPLPIQQEIARLLDKLTTDTAELIKQLEAEIVARRKQCDYYRDKLLAL